MMIFHLPTFDPVHGELVEGPALDFPDSFLRDERLLTAFVLSDLLLDEVVSPQILRPIAETAEAVAARCGPWPDLKRYALEVALGLYRRIPLPEEIERLEQALG